jgi:hypothetical protein
MLRRTLRRPFAAVRDEACGRAHLKRDVADQGTPGKFKPFKSSTLWGRQGGDGEQMRPLDCADCNG